jgi:hypothetical protein
MTRLVPPSVWLASVLLFLASLMWSAVTPGFQTPDELQHTNSVVRLAEGGGWPRPGDVLVEDETLDAQELAGAVVGGRYFTFPRGDEPIRPEAPYFANVTPTAVDDRLSFRELDDGPVDQGPIDQMTQHPRGYYGVAAAVYDVLRAGDWRYDRAMFLIRALTALMVAATVPVCCYIAARELSGRTSVGQVAAFVPLLIPQISDQRGRLERRRRDRHDGRDVGRDLPRHLLGSDSQAPAVPRRRRRRRVLDEGHGRRPAAHAAPGRRRRRRGTSAERCSTGDGLRCSPPWAPGPWPSCSAAGGGG